MALFGAPISHEDHAQRACYAALHLREEIARYGTEVKREHGVGFSTRMGINSGAVVVGTIGKTGDDVRMDYTAQGHTVGLAQRMEALVPRRLLLPDGGDRALVGGYFALEDLGEFRVKGVAEPVRVHRLIGLGAARTRFDISRARGLSRFVGRAAESPHARRCRRANGRGATARWWASWPRQAPGRAACAFEFSSVAAPAA